MRAHVVEFGLGDYPAARPSLIDLGIGCGILRRAPPRDPIALAPFAPGLVARLLPAFELPFGPPPVATVSGLRLGVKSTR
jgi:hypothetical protein